MIKKLKEKIKALFKKKNKSVQLEIANSGFYSMREFIDYLTSKKVKYRCKLMYDGTWEVKVGKADKIQVVEASEIGED